MSNHLFFYGVIISSSLILFIALKLIDRFSKSKNT